MANHLTLELAGVQPERRFLSAASPFASDKRKQPVVLDSESYSETVRVKLPARFAVDETPESGNLDAPFGTYRVSYKVDNGELLLTRSLEVKAATISPPITPKCATSSAAS